MIDLRKSIITLLIILAACLESSARDKTWLEITSPHFRVMTDGSEADGRRTAYEFEQIRSVFAQQFHGFRLDTGAPLLIFALRDEDSMKQLAPEMWKQKGAKPAGFFSRGWEQQYALIRLDQVGSSSYQVIYHEYIHSLLHMNFRWLPIWLDEGLAEFYGYTRFEKDQTYIGAPSNRAQYLNGRTLIPVETLIKVNHASPYYHEQDKVQMFYAESWALVHYLLFGPGMGTGEKLNQYYTLLQQRTDETQAFKQIFGDFSQMDKQLDQYARRFTYTAALFKTNDQQMPARNYTMRTLTAAESDAELGLFYFYQHNNELAKAKLDAALQADPKLGLAHEGEGFLDFKDGKDEDASKEFTQAYDLDPKLYLSLFFKIMMAGYTDVQADGTGSYTALLRIVESRPQFAPAFIELARIQLRKGNLENALRMATKASLLEPSRASYFLMTGRILTRMGRGAEAVPIAKFVAERWAGPDHNEAVQVWNEIPAAQRPADEFKDQILEGASTTEGSLSSLTCGDKDHKLQFTIDHDNKPESFIAAGGFMAGYSDTIWYGRDHFSLCHHLLGSHVVVRYKPSTDSNYFGTLAGIEVRELLPDMPVQAAPKAQ